MDSIKKYTKCPICDKDIRVFGKQKRKYCSVPCMQIGYKTQLKGENNPNYKHGPKYCETCNKVLNTGTQGNYCIHCIDRTGENGSFYGKHHSDETKLHLSKIRKGVSTYKGYRHTDEQKQKQSVSRKLYWSLPGNEEAKKNSINGLKKATQRQIEERGYTWPEQKMAEYLTKYKFEFIHNHFMFDKFFVDFYLPQYNTVVEVFGDYWHGNPEIFNELNSQQRKQSQKDKSRISYLKKALKNNLIIVWENDLKTNLSRAFSDLDTLLEHHFDCEN